MMPVSSSKIPEAAASAAETLRPILAKFSNGAGEFPDGFWEDHFVLGFTGHVIQSHTDKSYSRSERGYVLSHVYAALSDMNGAEIARKYIELQSTVPQSAEFANGDENAAIFMHASSEGVDESGSPLLDEVMRIAESRSIQNITEDLNDIILEKALYQPLRQRFPIYGDADEITDIGTQVDSHQQAVVLAIPDSNQRLTKKRSQAPLRAVSNDLDNKQDIASRQRSAPKVPALNEKDKPDGGGAAFDFSEFEEASRQIAALEVQVRELRRRGDNWQKAARVAALGQQKLKDLEAEVERLRGERESSLSKAQAAQAAFDDASRQLADFQTTVKVLREELKGQETEAHAARAAADDLRQRSAALSTERDKLRDERDRLVDQAKAAKETATDVGEHVSQLEAELAELRNERINLIERAEALEANVESLREQRDDWERKALAERTTADGIRQSADALTTEFDSLRDERDNLSSRTAAAEATVASIREHVVDLNLEIERLHDERNRWVEKARAGQQALRDREADARSQRRRIIIAVIFYAIFACLIAYAGISLFGSP